jgi:hypothetical protein
MHTLKEEKRKGDGEEYFIYKFLALWIVHL